MKIPWLQQQGCAHANSTTTHIQLNLNFKYQCNNIYICDIFIYIYALLCLLVSMFVSASIALAKKLILKRDCHRDCSKVDMHRLHRLKLVAINLYHKMTKKQINSD